MQWVDAVEERARIQRVHAKRVTPTPREIHRAPLPGTGRCLSREPMCAADILRACSAESNSAEMLWQTGHVSCSVCLFTDRGVLRPIDSRSTLSAAVLRNRRSAALGRVFFIGKRNRDTTGTGTVSRTQIVAVLVSNPYSRHRIYQLRLRESRLRKVDSRAYSLPGGATL